MSRPIEAIAGSYEKFASISPDVAYAVVLLRQTDALLKNAEDLEQIPVLKLGLPDKETRVRRASMGGRALTAKLTPEERRASAIRASHARWHPETKTPLQM